MQSLETLHQQYKPTSIAALLCCVPPGKRQLKWLAQGQSANNYSGGWGGGGGMRFSSSPMVW